MVRIDVKKLVVAMANKCMTVKELAKAIGTSTTCIYKIRRGYLAKVETIGKICKVLELDAEELITEVVHYERRKTPAS